MDIKEQTAVMLAFAEGKEIEVRQLGSNDWVTALTPGWNWSSFEYRIKPEPKFRPYTNVRIEHLQDISNVDCIAEGITHKIEGLNNGEEIIVYSFENKDYTFHHLKAKSAYASLIGKISGKGTWNANPFVFVYEFELVD